ncbi:hypothetical protein CQW23_07884 [Capsicum baccatum]|uniref:Uncharacterized protein n=1 Tax=Capsicum baccatum TaxID=33114 RepID=A0A2G2X7C8_CAPBA|nr:hypothetical protein CQW23_07884 [Capsicum baccatum]
MDHNESNNQLRATLHDVFGLENSDSLHCNEDSYGGYADGPDRYLDTDDEDVQNLIDEEMNRSHQSVQDKDLSVSDGEEDHYGEDNVEEKEDPKHDDSYTEEQYTTGPVEALQLLNLTINDKPSLKNTTRVDEFGSKVSTWSGPNGFPYFSSVFLGWFKYEKELEIQANERKQLVQPTIVFDWDIQIYGYYTRTIYDFFRVHVLRLPHCKIKRHVNFDAVDLRYILHRWMRDIVYPHLSKFFPGGYPTIMDEYLVYNGIKKWFDRNYDLVLDYPVRCRDLKNVLKTHFKTYMVWEDDMVVPNIPDSEFYTDATIVRNSREVRSRGRPQTNRNRSSHQCAFCRDARRWGYGYYDVYEKGKNSQGRSGSRRQGCRGSRGGGVCSSRGGRGDDANISNHPTVHEFF